jgi:hypothetical protein
LAEYLGEDLKDLYNDTRVHGADFFPRPTGTIPGWWTVVFTTDGDLGRARVYVVNLELGQACGWTTNLIGSMIFPFQSGPYRGGGSDDILPGFSFRRPTVDSLGYVTRLTDIMLVANIDTNRCEEIR